MRLLSSLLLVLLLPVPVPAGGQGAQATSAVRADALLRDALQLALQGDTGAALDRLEEAVRVAPGLAEAHYRRGLLLARSAENGIGDMFQRTRAGNALERASRLNPDDPRPYLELGRLRLKQGLMRLDEIGRAHV